MKRSVKREAEDVARYFDGHAADFDAIYEERKSAVRTLRDRLSRRTVVERLAFVDDLVSEREPGRLLDVGCGAGRFSIRLAQRGWRAVGMDFAPEMTALADDAAARAGVSDRCTFLTDDFLTWTADGRYDLGLAIGLFDYVADPAPLLAKLVALSGGSVVGSFPRLLHPLVPLRWIRLRLAGCPVHFYTRAKVERLAHAHLHAARIVSFHRDYLVVGDA